MAIETSFEPFVLTPLDHANPEVFVFFYLFFCVEDKDRAVQDISQGVNNLILRVPFLAGEIAPSTRLPGTQNVCEVRPSTSATVAMLQVKYHPSRTLYADGIRKANMTWRTSYTPPSVIYDPLPAVLPETQPRPVVRFQANILTDGIILTMAYNHVVIDGTGGGLLLELLAESCRSQVDEASANALTQVQDGYLRKLILNMSCSGWKGEHEGSFSRLFGTSSSAQLHQNTWEINPPRKLSEEHILFSSKKIDLLKQACNYVLAWLRENPSQLPGVDVSLYSFVSTNNVLTAFLWGLIIKARYASGGSYNGNEEQQRGYDCSMAVNLRPFLDPALLASYMGNTVAPLWVTVTLAELLRTASDFPTDLDLQVARRFGVDLHSILPIAYTAYRIRDQLNRIDNNYVRSLTTFLNARKDWNNIKYNGGDIAVSSWRHLKAYNLDFGQSLGHVISFGNQRSPVGNMCIILPASVPNKGVVAKQEDTHSSPWEVRVTLDEATMENFRSGNLLRWALQS